MSTDRDYLAAGLALGGLSDAEQAEAEALAADDADFRSEVEAYSESLALLADTDESQPVSEVTRNAILAIPSTYEQDQRTRSETAAADPENTRPASPAPAATTDLDDHRRKRSAWPLVAAAAAAIVIAGLGLSTWQLQQRQSELEETLEATQERLSDTQRLMQASDLRTSSAHLPDGGTVTVISSAREQLIHVSPHDISDEAGESLQMWVIGDDGPESAGLMTGQPVSIDGHDFTDDSVFGITVEPEGGSEQPTSEPVVAVEL